MRPVKAGVSIEQLAESIALRTLLKSLNVRAVVDAEGNEAGMFEVPAGGGRYRALELLVKQKRMASVFVSIDSEGRLLVDRGFVRPGDDLPAADSGRRHLVDRGQRTRRSCRTTDGDLGCGWRR